MSKTTVLQLIERLTIGGAENVVYRLVKHLRQCNYEPLVCCLSAGSLKADIEDQGVHVIVLNIPRPSIIIFPLFVIDMVKVIKLLISLVQGLKVDIIHAHLPNCAILGSIVGKLTRVGVVATYHGLKILPSNRKKSDPRAP